MANLELLKKSLPPQEEPGIPTVDSRFQEISTIAQEGNYAAAGAKIEALLQENIYDIRLIGFYLFAAFEEGGIAKVLEIFEIINNLLGESWAAVGPNKKKALHTDKSLFWLFGEMLKVGQHHDEKKDDRYQSWVTGASVDMMASILENLNKLKKNLSMNFPETPPEKTLEQLNKYQQWLKELEKVVYAEEQKRMEEEERKKKEDETRQAQKDAAGEAAANQGAQGGSGGSSGMGMGFAMGGGAGFGPVEGSYHMNLLIKKLQAFEILVSRGDLPKAALIANDVGEIVANFDPTLYLPKLFITFFALLSKHVEEISGFWGSKETLAWQTMEKLYRVDIDAFVDLEL